MRKGILVLALTVACAACTTTAYQPGVTGFVQSAGVMGPLVSDQAVELRREYRVSLLSMAAKREDISLTKLVCDPLAYTAAPLDSSSEVSQFGRAANDVAQAPGEKSFWSSLGGLFQSYELPAPKPANDDVRKETRLGAYDNCSADATSAVSANKYLVTEVGAAVGNDAQSRGGADPLSAISGIIEVVGPAVTEALTQIDQSRRAAALRAFFSDGVKVTALKEHVKSLKQFFATMDKYRRLRAMEAVLEKRNALPAQWATNELAKGGDNAPLQSVIAAATRYDVTYSAQLNPAFAAMEKSIKDLEDIAKGNNEAALLRSAYAASSATLQALEGLRQLSTDKVKREKLQNLIDKLLGKKPKEKREETSSGAAPEQEKTAPGSTRSTTTTTTTTTTAPAESSDNTTPPGV